MAAVKTKYIIKTLIKSKHFGENLSRNINCITKLFCLKLSKFVKSFMKGNKKFVCALGFDYLL